eukprot:scaffold3456_cov112-Cylindrotheca_fusiformis.AAC.1
MRSVTSKSSQVTQQSAHGSTGGGSESRGESESRSGSEVSGNENAKPPQVYTPLSVAKREEANVLRARGLVALILLLAVVSVATTTNLIIRQQERSEFETKFAGYATQILTASGSHLRQFFQALDSFASSIGAQAATDHALRNTSWPFYRMPEWSVQAQKLAQLTSVNETLIAFAPIVQENERDEWNRFATEQNPLWYQESIENEGYTKFTAQELVNLTVPFTFYYDRGDGHQPLSISRPGEVVPFFHSYPVGLHLLSTAMITNMDALLSSQQTEDLYRIAKVTRRASVGFTRIDIGDEKSIPGSQIVQPIFDGPNTDAEDREMVAVLLIQLPWMVYLKNLLAEGEDGIIVVIEIFCPTFLEDGTQNLTNSERNIVTYLVNGPDVVLLGDADFHDPEYGDLVVLSESRGLPFDPSKLPEGTCVPMQTIRIYPSAELEDSFRTNNDVIYTVGVVVIFVFTTLVFLLYDFSVGRRQRTVMERIMKQDRIVADVFPTAIRDRLYENHADGADLGGEDEAIVVHNSFVSKSSSISGSAPLAELFPSVTVVFADLVGFTAWSSTREPHHVFILLETIYGAFDKLAYRHGVFKVETVGDCYVSAVGLPEPREDHAVVACRFARDCIKKMKDATLKLEVSLGPDTSDLELRTGMHSGQVTAGVLRGQRSRFQLFGDTMNTASRMESSGERSRIQISEATADLIKEAGLARWILPRSRTINVKGKGEMQTYWVCKSHRSIQPKSADLKSQMETLDEGTETEKSSETGEEGDSELLRVEGMNRNERLVEWTVEVLTSLLEQIVGFRGGVESKIQSLSNAESRIGIRTKTVLDEFTPIIPLKRFDIAEIGRCQSISTVDIGEEAKSQLKHYISTIASMYPDNAYHNFQHACHVTASVKKLLSRIVAVGQENGLGASITSESANLVHLAGRSYGITSDPLTQFAVVFSAIIHDVDHPGVPNAQLIKENTRCAQIYKKSVAEQKSVDIAWDMLMEDRYADLRACIYQTEEDLRRFRQLVVNTVLATDIVDKDLQALRKARWETAFDCKPGTLDDGVDSEDRKATI